MSHVPKASTLALAFSALGVVFGDLGTSPLYTLRVCLTGQAAVAPNPDNILGLVSLIFWSLTAVVSIKYALCILLADDEGEGGIFAMMALLHKKLGSGMARNLTLLGCFGSALLYGDGLITPVISVLSALEGLEVATSQAKPLVVPLTCAVLTGLFLIQSRGTGKIGKCFGPVILVWFAAIGALGAVSIAQTPQVLAAVNPAYAVRFFLNNGVHGFFVLGAVVLCITGCEALYADMGHFGAKAIRLAWYSLAMPGLLLNYFGQAALLLRDPAAVKDPFYALVPAGLLYPMVALATAATIIASQAIISGVFSLTRQAMHLGYMPRMRIIHTSEMAEGQVYIPVVNFLMLSAALVLTVAFRQSENLADAYGIAVTADMSITSLFFFIVTQKIWAWRRLFAVPLVAVFWSLDLTYFGSCMVKFLSGGWFPVMIAGIIMFQMVTWRDGWRALGQRIFQLKLRIDQFMERIWVKKPLRLPGTGVYLSTFRTEVPPMLQYHINQTNSLHEKVVILSVYTSDVPVQPEAERVEVRNLGQGCFRVLGHFGFMEMPDIPELLAKARDKGLEIDPENVSYFLGRISLVPARGKRVLDPVRRFLFGFMQRNAVSPVVYYNIPPEKVLELGVQMEF